MAGQFPFKRLAVWACALGAFWVFAPMLSLDYVFVIVSSITFAVSVGVTVAYFGGAARASVRPHHLTRAYLLVLGIAAAWASNAARSMWTWTLRYFDRPEWMQDSLIPAFLIYILFWAGVFHLLATQAIDDDVPSQKWRQIGIVTAIAICVSLGLVYLTTTRNGSISDDILRTLGAAR